MSSPSKKLPKVVVGSVTMWNWPSQRPVIVARLLAAPAPPEPQARYEAARRIAVETGHRSGKAYALRLRGDLEMRRGYMNQARERYLASLAVYSRYGDAIGLGETALGLATKAAAQGAGPEARALYQEATRHFAPMSYFEIRRAQAGLMRLA